MKRTPKFFGTVVIVLAVVLTGCGEQTSTSTSGAGASGGANGGHSHPSAPHGGEILELGTSGHLELVHDGSVGLVKLYVLGADAKTPLPIEKAPALKIEVNGVTQLVPTQPVGGSGGKTAEFTATADSLKGGHLHGRVTVEIGGSVHNPDIGHSHDD